MLQGRKTKNLYVKSDKTFYWPFADKNPVIAISGLNGSESLHLIRSAFSYTHLVPLHLSRASEGGHSIRPFLTLEKTKTAQRKERKRNHWSAFGTFGSGEC